MPDGTVEFLFVSRSDVFAGQRFSCIGKSIHDIREECKQLHEQGVDSQNYISVGGSGRSKEHGNGNQTQGSEEDVPVYLKQAFHGVASKKFLPANVFPQRPIVMQPEQVRHEKSCILSYQRT
jgi:hypothetical protein